MYNIQWIVSLTPSYQWLVSQHFSRWESRVLCPKVWDEEGWDTKINWNRFHLPPNHSTHEKSHWGKVSEHIYDIDADNHLNKEFLIHIKLEFYDKRFKNWWYCIIYNRYSIRNNLHLPRYELTANNLCRIWMHYQALYK